MIWWRFPFNSIVTHASIFMSCSSPLFDHSHRMHVHPDHPDTASFDPMNGLMIPEMPRGCRQAYCAAELIESPTPKPTSSPTLCSVWWKWEMILLRLGKAKLNGTRKTITSRIWIESMECRRSSSGTMNFPGISVGPPREDSKITDRSTVWTGALQRQDHLHVNVQRRWMARQRKHRKMWIQFTDSCKLCSRIPSRSLVFLGAWIRKEMVRNLHWQSRRIMGPNCREHDGEFLRISVIRYFVPPVPLRKENWEAKEEARSLYTSTVVMKTSRCFSARWFLRINSVCTEP